MFVKVIFTKYSQKGRKCRMGSYRKGKQKKERIIMLASSVLVLTALTMTGIFVQNEKKESEDDGYTLDLTQEIGNGEKEFSRVSEDTGTELDYMPLEAGSDKIKLPGITDVVGEKAPEKKTKSILQSEDKIKEILEQQLSAGVPKDSTADSTVDSPVDSPVEPQPLPELHFSEADGLLRPVPGEILLPFSMDSSVYFKTLDQYKYHPAVLLRAVQGEGVTAAASGLVVSVFEDTQLGNCVSVDLGDGYLLTYGQLENVNVAVGDRIDAGTALGTVAAPTKYFAKEGAHLYLELRKGDVPQNPENLF